MSTLELKTITELSGRVVGDLTRRDVARALLTAPAAEVIDDLPGLRRELMAAGNPLSSAFWDSAEAILALIANGVATFGDVRRWLEATGTEPSEMVDFFLWPEEEDRGPVAREMHARLVTHLEEAVVAGFVDPDTLVAGDEAALAAHVELQRSWLTEPLEDGRVPAYVVEDEEAEGWGAEWDEAEADAHRILAGLLADVGERPLPEDELRRACAWLRRELPGGAPPYDLAAAAGGVDPKALPGEDVDLWLTLATGVVNCQDEPPLDGPDAMAEHAAWMSIELGDWIGAVVSLAAAGPGTFVDADTLARWAIGFDFESGEPADDVFESVPFDPDREDAATHLAIGFGVVTTLWQVLGAVDADERLTELGWWGVPEALLQAWAPGDETGLSTPPST